MILTRFSLLIFAAVVLHVAPSFALFDWLADVTDRGCKWNENDPNDAAVLMYERLSTTLPKGVGRKVIPFQEADFQIPWIKAFEYVIVVNNSSPYVHYMELPQQIPFITNPLSQFGIVDITKLGLFQSVSDVSESNAKIFLSQYADEDQKIKTFGQVVFELDDRGRRVPKRSELKQAQTVRIYRHGQLIRIAKISTGRGTFQRRGRKSHCEQPSKSYFTSTEPGYYTFQDLKKEYHSRSYDADMPNALFYNVGRGLALHEVYLDSKIATLGTPASGGCTRMDPDTAKNLFEAVRATEKSIIPVIDVYGQPVLDATGQLTYKHSEEIVYSEGTVNEKRIQTGNAYSALLIIQPDQVMDANEVKDKNASYDFSY